MNAKSARRRGPQFSPSSELSDDHDRARFTPPKAGGGRFASSSRGLRRPPFWPGSWPSGRTPCTEHVSRTGQRFCANGLAQCTRTLALCECAESVFRT
ncbi:hypothetical protein MRX96_005231 [Rhipicephalus microplus]